MCPYIPTSYQRKITHNRGRKNCRHIHESWGALTWALGMKAKPDRSSLFLLAPLCKNKRGPTRWRPASSQKRLCKSKAPCTKLMIVGSIFRHATPPQNTYVMSARSNSVTDPYWWLAYMVHHRCSISQRKSLPHDKSLVHPPACHLGASSVIGSALWFFLPLKQILSQCTRYT